MANSKTLSGTVLYSALKAPKLKYESQTRREFTIEVAVDKATARAWDKTFKKQAAKVFDNKDFVETFGIDLPYPDQDEQFVVKIKRPADYEEKDKATNTPTGRILPVPEKWRPRVLHLVDPTTRKCVDITYKEFGVGRGSKATVQYEERDSGKFGTTARLMNVRIDELIKYETGNSFDELGQVDELAENPYENSREDAPAASTNSDGHPDEDDIFND